MDIQEATLELAVRDTVVEISYLRRSGVLAPLVCMHGFGSTKEDYADLALRRDFSGRDLILFDAPGFGQSTIKDPDTLSIPTLVDVAIALCDAIGLQQFHLCGHSMGGLVGLLLCQSSPDRVLSFIDIEGNLAPEDCFLSRQIIQYSTDDPEEFMQGFASRVKQIPTYSTHLYVSSLPLKVQANCVRPVFTSMVNLSDNTPLLEVFAALPCPRLFVYGEQNRDLSYLDKLPGSGADICEIAFAGHFPMYSNPPALWSAMSSFLERCESDQL